MSWTNKSFFSSWKFLISVFEPISPAFLTNYFLEPQKFVKNGFLQMHFYNNTFYYVLRMSKEWNL